MQQMPMNVDSDTVRSSLGRNRIESISKAIIAIVSVLFLAYLVQFVPGTEHLVPASSIDGGHVIGAGLTLVVVGLLVYLSSALARLLELVLDGPPVLTDSVISIIRWLVLLSAVVVAHSGLEPLADSVLGGLSWAFDVAALFVAIPALLVIAFRLYVGLDPAARYLAATVTGTSESD